MSFDNSPNLERQKTTKIQFDYSGEEDIRKRLERREDIDLEEVFGRAKEIGFKIELEIEQILKRVRNHLIFFIPDYELDPNIILKFGFFERADFRTDGIGDVYVDLLRLSRDPNYLETFEKGLTHEIFHIWFINDYDWSAEDSQSVDIESLRRHILFRIVDEGFAVFISGQSLIDFYKKKNRSYEESLDIGRDFLSKIITEGNKDSLVEIKRQGFESMGPLYVLGFETIKELYEKEGIDFFRKRLAETKSTKDVRSFF